jgi:hypothetical protein
VDFYDHIQHDYAIRYMDRKKGGYDYRILVQQGTHYPSQEPVASLKVKASYTGQTHLGLAIFEIGEQGQSGGEQALELVFDPSGAARVVPVAPDESDRRAYFWMNEGNPIFLVANPPAKQGEARYEIEFAIDGNKRLLITARDIKTGQVTHRNYPVVKLT